MDPEESKINSDEYKQVVQLIKDTEKEFKDIKDTVLHMVTDFYHLKENVIDAVISIPNVAEGDTPDSATMINIKKVISNYTEDDFTYEDKTDDEVLDAFRAAKNASNVIKSSEKELSNMKKDASDIVSGYISYMSSPEAAKSRKEKLEAMEAAYEIETDEYSKKKMKEKIEALRATIDFSFLFKRLEGNDKEIKNIVDIFFDKKRGSYIIEKYVNKIHLFKFDKGIYKMFFNLEENFLPEEYHDFNNLFLFVYMRYVAYRDPYKREDFLRVHSITSALARLVYHKFNNNDTDEVQDTEPGFVNDVIAKMDDLFKDYKDYFHENNSTRPGHESREKAQAEHDLKRRATLLKKMEEFGMEITDELKNMPANELQKLFNEKTDELIEQQRKDMTETNLDNVTVTEDEDGSVVVAPNLDNINKNDNTSDEVEDTKVSDTVIPEDIKEKIDIINKDMVDNWKPGTSDIESLMSSIPSDNVVDFKSKSDEMMNSIK